MCARVVDDHGAGGPIEVELTASLSRNMAHAHVACQQCRNIIGEAGISMAVWISSVCEIEAGRRELSGVVGEVDGLSQSKEITWLNVDPSLSVAPRRRKRV